jgi:heme oxygenase
VRVRAALREATAAAHEEVDGIFSRFDLRRREPYRRFLRAQASALLPIETALDEAGAGAILGDWPARRRSEALREDLKALGAEPPAPTAAPAFATPEAVLGGIYVLEGARLGGALLSRALPDKAPQAFLGAAGDSLRWRKLLEDLEKLLYRHDQVAAAVSAAVDVFACFAAAGRRELESASP